MYLLSYIKIYFLFLKLSKHIINHLLVTERGFNTEFELTASNKILFAFQITIKLTKFFSRTLSFVNLILS